MNQSGIAPLIIAVIAVVVVVVAGVGVYIVVIGGGEGGEGGGIIGSATSISFKMDTTSEGTPISMALQIKDIGSPNVKYRVEGAFGSREFKYIINAAENKAWQYQGGAWTDASSQFDNLLSDYQSLLEGISQSEWSGGDIILNDPTGGTTRFYDIQVNPSLPDNLFQPSSGSDDGGSGIIGSATSISFNMDTTSGEAPVTITLQGTDIHSDNIRLRIEGTSGGFEFKYIINAVENKAWEYQGGTWVDISSQFSSLLADYQSLLQGISQSEWDGGDIILTNDTGDTTRVYDIQVNLSLSDNLFQPSPS